MKKFLALLFAGLFTFQSVGMAAWPSSSARTKEWSSSETLTEPDLEGQFDVLHTYLNDALNSATGHDHDGTAGNGPEINITNITVASQAQGDLIYASSASAWARLGAGTAGKFLRTAGAAANPSWETVPTAPRASFSKLSITRSSATAVAVTANDLVLYDTNNAGVTINSVSESIAITTSGASGLVSSLSEAANTVYYIWIARKSSDGTVNGYLSTTTSYATFLTQVDSGYDQVALVGCVANDNSSNFIAFTQTGNKYFFTSWASMASGNVGTGAWTSIDMTPANMSTNPGFVPSALSNVCFGVMGASAAINIMMTNDNAVSSATSTIDRNKICISSTTADSNPWMFEILTADTLYWGSDAASAVVYLQGFELNKL